MGWNPKRGHPTRVLPLLLMLPAVAWGAETHFALTSTAVITDGAGSSRVLLDFGDLTSALAGELVTSAMLEIQLPGPRTSPSMSPKRYARSRTATRLRMDSC